MSFEAVSQAICDIFSVVSSIFFPQSLLHTDVDIVSQDKLTTIEIEYLSFSGEEKCLSLEVLDVLKDDISQIFQKLKKRRFPIYALTCFFPKNIGNGNRSSLHAYAAAIDINYLMNPHYDAVEGTIIPSRRKDRKKDRETIINGLKEINIADYEISSILDTVIGKNQSGDSDDMFLNRGILRKGMVTPEVVNIFKSHGFNIWGGNWRRPMDYMHFQLPRSLAKQLVDDKKDFKSRKKIWEEHKRKINKTLSTKEQPETATFLNKSDT